MMDHFRKRFSDEDLRQINELVVQRGKEMLIEAAATQSHDDSSGDDKDDGDQLSLDSLIKLGFPRFGGQASELHR